MTTRFRIMIGAVAAILIANSLLALLGAWYLGQTRLEEVQDRVRIDLHAARAAYDMQARQIETYLAAAALDRSLADGLARGETDRLESALKRIHGAGSMDFLVLLDAEGRAVYRPRHPSAAEDDLSHNPLVSKALQLRESVLGTVRVDAESLAREDPQLARRARLQVLPTEAARPTTDRFRTGGLVIGAAVPVENGPDAPLGALYGGVLLNRRYELVDDIQDVVFAKAGSGGHDARPTPAADANRPDRAGRTDGDAGANLGTVTIFQDDLRIATNVKTAAGKRAVGTRLSDEVYSEVLERGGTWAAPAFVVNDWYITAYEPIRDPEGEIVGALYVGLLQAPYLAENRRFIGGFVLLVMLTSVVCAVAIFFVARHVLRPVGRIVEMSKKIVAGDLSARVGIRPAGEFGVLCEAVDQMAESAMQRESTLKETATKQIGQSEKLASIGRLAAGVAHEINNPLTGVLTFSHLLREKETMDDQDREDLDLIIRETTRAAEIVRRLLDFSRERPPVKESLHVNQVIHRTMALIRNQKLFDRIYIQEQFADGLPPVLGDVNQLQQVFLNLSLNACAAMPDGGDLTLSTRRDGDDVLIGVSDTGSGIAPEHLPHIFDPFFTTQPVGKGTGLGLSVSYGIVRQHGGDIDVSTQVDRGTTFTIRLPSRSKAETDEADPRHEPRRHSRETDPPDATGDTEPAHDTNHPGGKDDAGTTDAGSPPSASRTSETP